MWFNRRNVTRQQLVQSLLGDGIQTNDPFFKRWDIDDWDKLIEYIEKQCGSTNVWEDVFELSEEKRWDYGNGPDTDSTWSNTTTDTDDTAGHADASAYEDGQGPDGADTSDEDARKAFDRAKSAYRHYLRKKYRKSKHLDTTDGSGNATPPTDPKVEEQRSNGLHLHKTMFAQGPPYC